MDDSEEAFEDDRLQQGGIHQVREGDNLYICNLIWTMMQEGNFAIIVFKWDNNHSAGQRQTNKSNFDFS